jgi:hypothetical protein
MRLELLFRSERSLPGASTRNAALNALKIRFFATLGEEPDVEVGLI